MKSEGNIWDLRVSPVAMN